jgi:hypothetical protein
MKIVASAFLSAFWLLVFPTAVSAAESGRTIKEVQFAKGSSTAVIKGRITGYNYVDYQLRAGAGQTMKVAMQVTNLANYYNILPPGSPDAAMYIGQTGENKFDGLLPDDGVYTIRVYLMRSAARRKESSDYTLSVGITGKPLPPVSPKIDAVLSGTHYHAKGIVKCEPKYTKARECEALVIRRTFDGTATVELRWDKSGKRRILFVKGKPEVADVPWPMTFTRNERGWVVVFGGDERFEIPEALVFGG